MALESRVEMSGSSPVAPWCQLELMCRGTTAESWGSSLGAPAEAEKLEVDLQPAQAALSMVSPLEVPHLTD